MIKKIILIGFIITLNYNGFSFHSYNSVPLDSLLIKLYNAKTKIDTIDVYFQLSSHYVNSNINKAEYYANEILKQSIAINYKKGEADGYYSLANIFHNSHYDISYNFAQKALEIYKQLGNKYQIAKSLNLISVIIGNLGETESTLDYSNQVLQISLEIGDSILYAMVLNNIGTYYSSIDNDSIANEYYKKAAEVNLKTGHKRFLSINYGNMCISLIKERNTKAARYYYYKSKALKIDINDKDGFGWLYDTYGNILEEEGKIDSALYYYNKSNSLCKQLNNKNQQEKTISSLHKLYYKLGNIDSAYFWLTKLNTLQDSIYDIEKTKSIYLHEINLKHKQEQELSRLKYKTKVFKLAFVISVLSILFLLTSMVIYIMNNRRKKIIIEREKANYDKENLEQELNKKNQELATYVMGLVNTNERVNKAVGKLDANIELFAKKNQNTIRRIISELKTGANKDIWKEFEYRFNQVHPNFVNKLLKDYPDLTPNELKICSFLKMNMSSKEISLITHQSIQSIEKARSRLRKKINLTNTNISFVYFLSKY